MPWLITLIVAPFLFFLVTWVVVTCFRILRREEPVRVERASTFVHRRTRARKIMMVSEREGRDSRGDEDDFRDGAYTLSEGWSSGIPNAWHSELWIRRN